MSTVESIVPESTVTESQSIHGVSDENTASAERIIQDHVLLAVASGLVPGPGLDLVAAFTVQLTMLKRLATLYDVPFRQDAAKSTVTALFGTLGGAGAAAIAGASFLKFIPVVGTAVGIAGTSVAFGAFTYAIGKVFLRHFESGGTFIDLNPRAYREYFREMNVRGRTVAAEKQEEAKTAGKSRPRRTAAPAAAEA
ncbi:YcjF family protein [Chelatococcus sp. GCM10030263]|uniref:YcjF family protein n=1 Tax=Chelatococcus sp. GCM10030263 TaxID=3273387 RepID=UPI003622D77E